MVQNTLNNRHKGIKAVVQFFGIFKVLPKLRTIVFVLLSKILQRQIHKLQNRIFVDVVHKAKS